MLVTELTRPIGSLWVGLCIILPNMPGCKPWRHDGILSLDGGGNGWFAKGHSAFAKPRRRRQLSGATIEEEITSNLRMTMVVGLCGEIPVWVYRGIPSSGSEGLACIRPPSHWTQLEKLDKVYVKNLFRILECYTKVAKILGRREIKRR